MDAKNVDTVIEVLAETVRSLKTDIYFKDLEIDSLKAQLKTSLESAKVEAENG